MSYSLFLVRVPPNSSEEEVERAVQALDDVETSRPPGASNAEAESRKRKLAEALLEKCPELEGGEPAYAALARAEHITEEEARRRYRWWSIVGPEEGAGFSITLYDTFVTVDMAAGGTEQDWEDLSRYLRILVQEGGFTVWDPQGPNVMDVPTEPAGDAARKEQPPPGKRRRSRKKPPAERSTLGDTEDGDNADGDDAEGDVEREDVRRGGEAGRLINRIIGESIADSLSTAGFRRAGRTWRRSPDEGIVQVINVQWSPRRDDEGWFTLNAGVYFRALAESLALFPVSDTPREFDCHVRKRPLVPGVGGWTVRVPGSTRPDLEIGNGFFSKLFTWLERRNDAKTQEQMPRATRELSESLERHAFPWLEQVSTLQGARDYLLQRGPGFWAAHASLLLGERDEAIRILRKEIARSNAEHVEVLCHWGRENGLID